MMSFAAREIRNDISSRLLCPLLFRTCSARCAFRSPARSGFGSWFGPCGAHVGNLGASWGALGHFGGVVERIWVSLAPFGRFGVGFLVYFRSIFHFFCVIFYLFVDIFLHLKRS